MFVKANDKLINLKNVSSINFLHDRIAFDFNTPVELDSGKIISYYAYDQQHNSVDDIKNNKYIEDNFLRYTNGVVNIDHICAIKFSDRQKRVIYNLSHSTTSSGYDKKERLTSKFIYVDFTHEKEYNEYKDYVLLKLQNYKNSKKEY